MSKKIKITVSPQRELMYNEESYFGIYGCRVIEKNEHKVNMNKYGNISVAGNMVQLEIGKHYVVELEYDANSKYEGSYRLIHLTPPSLDSAAEQREFLKMILTEKQIENIYAYYGLEANILKLVEEEKFDYKAIKGLGEITYFRMKEKIKENEHLSEALAFFGKYGIKFNLVASLAKKFEDPSILIQEVKKNPYILTNIRGVGFKTADNIAQSIGFDLESEERIVACLTYCIEEKSIAESHSWISGRMLLNQAVEYLQIPNLLIKKVLKSDAIPNLVRLDGDRYTTENIYKSESSIAKRLVEFASRSVNKVIETEQIDAFLDKLYEKEGIKLDEYQRQFFHDYNKNGVVALIGEAGMGKSFLVNLLLRMIEDFNIVNGGFRAVTPTGRSAKVLSDYIGREATTIHRAVGANGDDLDYDSSGYGLKPLNHGLIIIDEFSMCDIFIVSKLMKTIKNPNARIIIIGDDFQLASVGVGNLLYDIINSGSHIVKICQLKNVYRQGKGGILSASQAIRHKERKFFPTGVGRHVIEGNFVLKNIPKEEILDDFISVYIGLHQKYGVEKIAVLSPVYEGMLGINALNREIQKIVNPSSIDKEEIILQGKKGDVVFREGDLIMNLRNIYDAEIWRDGEVKGETSITNGDTGILLKINHEEKYILVDFYGTVIKLSTGYVKARGITHGWCMSVHKSQGGQYKIVVVIADKSMSFPLNANSLYTGLSRAKDFLLLYTQPQTLFSVMSKSQNQSRRSLLGEMLEQIDLKEK